MARTKFQNYDASFKIAMCEEYFLRKTQQPYLKALEFAKEKGIKKSTFYDWTKAYSDYMKTSGNDGLIITSNNDEVTVPKFIEISDRVESTVKAQASQGNNNITLKYKDALLEFDVNNLDKVMEIIRRW